MGMIRPMIRLIYKKKKSIDQNLFSTAIKKKKGNSAFNRSNEKNACK